MVAKAIQAAAALGVADLIHGAPRDAEELASLTGTHGRSLFRLLRALASIGIFRQDDTGKFENTSLSEALRSGVPMSARDYVMYAPHDGNMKAWMQLESVLKTGEPSFIRANGADMWGYFKAHPQVEERFNRAMTALAAGTNEMVAQAYNFGAFERIIDVGGGQGTLLAAILRKNPSVFGALFDLAPAATAARKYLADAGLGGRTEVIEGDVSVSIPAGFDAYVMKNVLHDFSDERARIILERCRSAIPAHGKLLIIDAVMTPGNAPHPAKWFDLHMMVALGGRERPEEDFRTLLGETGFRMTLAKPLPGLAGVVEAVPC